MARSTYIYVVLEKPLDDLIIACTVKRELVDWLKRQTETRRADLVVERIKDGKPVELGGSVAMGTAAEFLEDHG
jgi:hypothetical protein